MKLELNDKEVDIEFEDGPMTIRSLGVGRLFVSGPTKGFEDSDPYIRVAIGHRGEAVEWGDGTVSEPGDFAHGSMRLTMDEAEELYYALGTALEEDPDVLFEHEREP